MLSNNSRGGGLRSTRRAVLRGFTALGTVGVLAGCSGADSSPSTSSSDGSSDPTGTTSVGTDSTQTPTTTAESASFDCETIPSSLAAFESGDVEFSFTFDAPSQPAYALTTAEDAVERVATFYFAREGTGSSNNWDFYVELSESVDTYSDQNSVFPKATEAFRFDYGGTTVPVRHQAITDDQDVWVLGLPENAAFRIVRVSSAVMPKQFGCHAAVRAVAKDVVKSIQPR